MQGFRVTFGFLFRTFIRALVLGAFLPGCSRCSSPNGVAKFQGFHSAVKTNAMVQNSGVLIEVQTAEAGKVSVEFPKESFSKPEKIHVIAGKNQETDDEFKEHPNTIGLKKLEGELRITVGKEPPKKSVSLCLTHILGSDPKEELIPLVYEYYDGENETLTYFTKIDWRAQQGNDRGCLELKPIEFSNLNNSEGRFEALVVFARKERVQ